MKRTNKLPVIAILVFIMAVMSRTVTFASVFTDIQGHWCEESIKKLDGYKVVNGYKNGSFMPDGKITRAEFVTMISRVFGFKNEAEYTGADVDANVWFAHDIKKGLRAGYIRGYADGLIRPDNNITRQEMAVMLTRVFSLTGIGKNAFADKNEIAPWAEEAINILTDSGIVNGYPEDKTFRPQTNITRAEFVKMLDRLIKKLVNTSGEYDLNNEITDGNLLVGAENTVIKNAVINGNLYILPSVGESDIALENINVKGQVIIQGGGISTVKIINSTIEEVRVLKQNPVTVVFQGGKISIVNNSSENTKIEFTRGVDVKKIDILIKTEIVVNNDATISDIKIADTADGTFITGTGKIERITVDSADINIASGVIVAENFNNTGEVNSGSSGTTTETNPETNIYSDISSGYVSPPRDVNISSVSVNDPDVAIPMINGTKTVKVSGSYLGSSVTLKLFADDHKTEVKEGFSFSNLIGSSSFLNAALITNGLPPATYAVYAFINNNKTPYFAEATVENDKLTSVYIEYADMISALPENDLRANYIPGSWNKYREAIKKCNLVLTRNDGINALEIETNAIKAALDMLIPFANETENVITPIRFASNDLSGKTISNMGWITFKVNQPINLGYEEFAKGNAIYIGQQLSIRVNGAGWGEWEEYIVRDSSWSGIFSELNTPDNRYPNHGYGYTSDTLPADAEFSTNETNVQSRFPDIYNAVSASGGETPDEGTVRVRTVLYLIRNGKCTQTVVYPAVRFFNR